MKKTFIIFSMLCFANIFAQTSPLDLQLVNINQSTVTSDIIYERVSRFANLYSYNQNGSSHNTASYQFFEQALSELYRASNKTKLISHTELRNRITAELNIPNVVNIGIINTPFSILNYNYENPAAGGLNFNGTLYSQIPNNPPFFDLHAIVIAPLKEVIVGNNLIFNFKTNLIFNNGTKTIKTLTANFGDGINRTIINNGIIVLQTVYINNTNPNGDMKLAFSIVFNDNTMATTYGKIFATGGSSNQPLSALNRPSPCDDDPIKEDLFSTTSRLISDYPYQGLGETQAINGQIEARVFYHSFLSDGITQNTQKKLLKPIIIIDGFDPDDKRKIQDCDCEADPVCTSKNRNSSTGLFNPDNYTSFQDLMAYKDELDQPKNIINILRSIGYDVILVNQPTYWLTDPLNPNAGRKINGGADFVERNGLALATLIKRLNVKLAQNNSTEKLVIMGPSMGGQISRYALAWMEKKFAETGLLEYNHNTRLWVAFDSPNHGANVPMGDQALINLLKDASTEVEKVYNESLNSTASKEMMIELHEQGPDETTVNASYLNGSTISQGMPTNSGNPFYQSHYNNQFNNGVPNSKGFPQNLRKIAIVNGSLSGKIFGGNLENMLDVRGIQRVCVKPASWFGIGGGPSYCFTIKLAEMQAWTLPASSVNDRIAYFDKIVGAGKHTNTTNFNNRGNMDIVAGGKTDIAAVINASITGRPVVGGNPFKDPLGFFTGLLSGVLGGADWQTRNLMADNSFIPTYSSIGIKNPNQSWSNPLDRNLVCSNETYFDSYFGEAANTTHTKLNYNMVNWLLKELAGPPQAPSFPIDQNALVGDNIMCKNTSKTYSFPDVCKVPSAATWSVSSNLQIVSASSYAVVVSQTSTGQATITATFQNGQTLSKNIWIGAPAFMFQFNYFDVQPIKSTVCAVSAVPDVTLQQQGVTNVTYRLCGSNIVTNYQDNFCMMPRNSCCIEFTATNNCGSTTETYDCFLNKQSTKTDYYTVYPNPSKDIVNIDLRDESSVPEKAEVISGELFDIMGLSRAKIEIINNKATFSVSGLNQGIYILKIYINNQVESHQIAVQ